MLGLVAALAVAGSAGAFGESQASVTPVSIAFWDARHGLLGAIDRSRCARPPRFCRTAVSTTSDGGRTWKVRYRAGEDISHVTAVPGGRRAWAGADCAADASCPPLRSSANEGESWRIVRGTTLYGLTFGTSSDGWAVKGNRDGLTRLVGTSDGGRTWLQRRSPCERSVAFEQQLSLAGQRRGWILCLGEPGAGSQGKRLFATSDGGRRWRLRSSSAYGFRNVGHGLPGSGYGAGIQFRPGGRGWLWESRGSFLTTRDGGRTWQVLSVSRPEIVEAISVSFVSDRIGFALFRTPAGIALARTRSAGSNWVTIRIWRGAR